MKKDKVVKGLSISIVVLFVITFIIVIFLGTGILRIDVNTIKEGTYMLSPSVDINGNNHTISRQYCPGEKEYTIKFFDINLVKIIDSEMGRWSIILNILFHI